MNRFITDDELRERGVSELDIDALNFIVRTQIGLPGAASNARYLRPVEEVLAARGVTVNLRSGE